MAQPKNRPASPPVPAPAGTPWQIFVLVAMGGALLGAAGTYFTMQSAQPRPVLNPAMAAPAAPLTLPAPDTGNALPPVQGERNLGNFYYDQSNWPEAIRHYEAAMKAGDDDPNIRTDLGNAYQFSGRPADAIAQYTAAQRLDPNHEFSLFNQGAVYLERLNQPQKAIEVWTEYLRRFPQGRNVAAAQQLIAHANESLAGRAPASAGSAAEEKLLRLVPPAPAAGKP